MPAWPARAVLCVALVGVRAAAVVVDRVKQVTTADFTIWQDALGDRPAVTMILYSGLGHLCMPIAGGGMATPTDYTVAGYVAPAVIQAIVDWLA